MSRSVCRAMHSKSIYGGGRDLADHRDQVRGRGRFAGHSAHRILRHDRIKNRVRDLIADFVRMSFGNRLRGEEQLASGAEGRHARLSFSV